jgi:FixJ family two-component response regulator
MNNATVFVVDDDLSMRRALAVRAIQAGAIEFLPKPFQDDELLDAIQRALSRFADIHRDSKSLEEIGRRLSSLTDREREVLQGVVSGMLNKQIGGTLGITEKTVKVHRASVMEKMGVPSLAELVRMVAEFERLSATRRPG